MTHKEYNDLFSVRGHQYDHAMRMYPGARDQEFLSAVNYADFQANPTVLDVPAGGKYLESYLPAGCSYLAHEPCANFDQKENNSADTLLPLPFAKDQIDIAFSIAGVHHLADKEPLFTDLKRVIKPGGQLILCDVYEDSDVAFFLDEFVGKYNSTGHEGVYLNQDTLKTAKAAGWEILSAERRSYQWLFGNEQAMAAFCISLFDLRGISHNAVISEIKKRIGVTQTETGVGINWELFFIRAINPNG